MTLTWTKRAAGKWVLKATDGQIWAIVAPYRSEFSCKNQFKATVLGEERNRGSVARYGCNHWTTGIGVATAKRNVTNWLARNAYDSFQIAA